jgi:hypothetical protein
MRQDARVLERGVQACHRGHRLDFDDLAFAARLQDTDNDPVGLVSVARPMHLAAGARAIRWCSRYESRCRSVCSLIMRRVPQRLNRHFVDDERAHRESRR